MSHANYERLSAADASFLNLEKPSLPLHISATLLYESGVFATQGNGIDIEVYKAAVEAVLLQRQTAARVRAAERRDLAASRTARLTRDKAYRIVSRKKSRPIVRSESTYAATMRGGIKRGKKRGSAYLQTQSTNQRNQGNRGNAGRNY